MYLNMLFSQGIHSKLDWTVVASICFHRPIKFFVRGNNIFNNNTYWKDKVHGLKGLSICSHFSRLYYNTRNNLWSIKWPPFVSSPKCAACAYKEHTKISVPVVLLFFFPTISLAWKYSYTPTTPHTLGGKSPSSLKSRVRFCNHAHQSVTYNVWRCNERWR